MIPRLRTKKVILAENTVFATMFIRVWRKRYSTKEEIEKNESVMGWK